MSNLQQHLTDLASRLADTKQYQPAIHVAQQVLQLTNIRDLKTITPEHPLYPMLSKVLRKEDALGAKLEDFQTRTALKEPNGP